MVHTHCNAMLLGTWHARTCAYVAKHLCDLLQKQPVIKDHSLPCLWLSTQGRTAMNHTKEHAANRVTGITKSLLGLCYWRGTCFSTNPASLLYSAALLGLSMMAVSDLTISSATPYSMASFGCIYNGLCMSCNDRHMVNKNGASHLQNM